MGCFFSLPRKYHTCRFASPAFGPATAARSRRELQLNTASERCRDRRDGWVPRWVVPRSALSHSGPEWAPRWTPLSATERHSQHGRWQGRLTGFLELEGGPGDDPDGVAHHRRGEQNCPVGHSRGQSGDPVGGEIDPDDASDGCYPLQPSQSPIKNAVDGKADTVSNSMRCRSGTLDHSAVTEAEDLSAMGTKVDNVRPLNEGSPLRSRVHLRELLFAVRAQRHKIFPSDDRERSVAHP